jgi:hypothetical protein
MYYDTESKIRAHQVMIHQLPLAEGYKSFTADAYTHTLAVTCLRLVKVKQVTK